MGGGKTQTSTQQVQIPPEVLARYNAVNARSETVAEKPFQQYSGDPNAFVAPMTATQQAGLSNANQAAGMAQPYYQAATGMTMGGAQNVGALTPEQIQYYQNPYTQAVAAPTIAALQQQQAEQTQGAIGNAIRSGAFGGDRAGIQMANLARQQGLGMAQAINPIYQQAYQNATQTAAGQQGVVAQDLQRQLAAGQQLAGLGSGAQQALLGGAQAQMGAGTAEQQTQQAGLQALYNQFQQERAYPFQLAQFLANIAMGTGSLSGSTTTTTQPAGFFSDERLKENMRPVGKTKDGQTIYSFNYKGDKRTQIGLSAQEVAEKHPEAVGKAEVPGLGGAKALTVDYKKATADAAKKAEGGPLEDKPIAPKAGLMAFQPPQIAAVAPAPIEARPTGLSFVPPQPNIAGGVIPIQPFAGPINRAPQAEGLSLGTREGWEAELASLYSGRPFESGEQYGQMRRQQLTDKLAGNEMAPMVITPPQPPSIEEPVWADNWARGGYVDRPGYYGIGGRPERARGGMTDATWQAILSAVGAPIEVYGGKSPAGMGGSTPGSGGGYGSMAKNPVAISKLATAARIPSPAPSGFSQAVATGQSLANLYTAGKGIGQDIGLIKKPPTPAPTTGQNPNPNKPAIGARETNAPPSVARASLGDIFNAPTNDAQIDLGDSERAIELAKMPDDLGSFGLDGMSESPFFAARGGRTGYNLRGGVPYKDNGNFDPSEGPRAPNGEGDFSDLLGSVIDSGASQPKGRPDAPPSARPQGGDSGIGGLTKLAKAGKSMYDAGSKAASGLGKLTGTAAEAGAPTQLAGATLANEGATGLGGVLAADLPALGAAEAGGAGLGALGGEAAGAGLGALGAEAAGAAGAALGAEALGATAAAAAPAALGATAAAAAPAAAAVGGEAILAMLPFLLSDRRSKHDDEVVGHLFDGQPVHTFKYNNGDNRTRMGMMTDESDRSAVHNIGGLEMLDYKRATDVATGLAPRQAAQTGGLFVDPNMPAEGAVETALNVPRELQPLIAKASAETGIPASIIAATIAQESGFRKDAVGGAGEIGLMQVKPSTAARPGFGVPPMSQEKLKTPAGNITFGSNYLAGRARNLGVDPSDPAAIAAFNSGSAKDEYARKVMAKAGQYDPAVDAKYVDMPARNAIETAKDVIRPGKPSAKKEDSFTDKLLTQDFLVPAVAGIGSMLASTRPTFGGALGEGLVGGASAYTALQKQQADIEKTGEEARKSRIESQQAAITRNPKGYPIYAIIDGKTVPFYEIYANPGKYNLTPQLKSEVENIKQGVAQGDKEAIAATKSPTGATLAPAPTSAKPTAQELEKPEEPKNVSFSSPIRVTVTKSGGYDYNIPPVDGGYSDKNFKQNVGILKNVDIAGNPGAVGNAIQSVEALAAKAEKDAARANVIINGAATATQTMTDLRQLASSINKLDDKGFATSGAGQRVRVNLIRYINSAVDMLGLDRKYRVSSDQVSNTEIADKIRVLGSVTAAKTGNQSAAQIANSIANAMPSGVLDKSASNNLIASMMIANQRTLDFQKFYSAYIGKYNTAYDVEKMFNKIMGPVYAKEKKLLMNAFKSYKKDGKSLSYADLIKDNPERAAAFDKNMKSSGLARYWR